MTSFQFDLSQSAMDLTVLYSSASTSALDSCGEMNSIIMPCIISMDQFSESYAVLFCR